MPPSPAPQQLDLARLDDVLRRVSFVPPPRTWPIVARRVRADADWSLTRTIGLVFLCYLLLATMLYGFHRALGLTLTPAP